jgi:hypothetical protein
VTHSALRPPALGAPVSPSPILIVATEKDRLDRRELTRRTGRATVWRSMTMSDFRSEGVAYDLRRIGENDARDGDIRNDQVNVDKTTSCDAFNTPTPRQASVVGSILYRQSLHI